MGYNSLQQLSIINNMSNSKKTKQNSAKAPTKKATKTKKVNSLEQANGKVDAAKNTSKELDKILGMRQKNPYNATTMAEFEENLKGKSLTDLREMCVAAGIFPNGNPTLLRKKLTKGFDSFLKGGGSSAAPSIPSSSGPVLPDSELQERINKIWSGK